MSIDTELGMSETCVPPRPISNVHRFSSRQPLKSDASLQYDTGFKQNLVHKLQISNVSASEGVRC